MVYGNVKDAKIPARKRKKRKKDDRIVDAKGEVDRFKRAPQIKAEMYKDYGVYDKGSKLECMLAGHETNRSLLLAVRKNV